MPPGTCNHAAPALSSAPAFHRGLAMSLRRAVGPLLVFACLLSPAVPSFAAAGTPPPAAEAAGALEWRLVGPFRGGWATMAEGVPSQPDTFYIGTAGGGVWKTIDAGRTWQPLMDHVPAAP